MPGNKSNAPLRNRVSPTTTDSMAAAGMNCPHNPRNRPEMICPTLSGVTMINSSAPLCRSRRKLPAAQNARLSANNTSSQRKTFQQRNEQEPAPLGQPRGGGILLQPADGISFERPSRFAPKLRFPETRRQQKLPPPELPGRQRFFPSRMFQPAGDPKDHQSQREERQKSR